MDVGVIRSLKAHYRLTLVSKIIQNFDERKGLPKINVMDAMFMASSSWISVTAETIVNCFRKAGISPAAQEK